MSQVQQLYRLQQYDNEITRKKRRLAEVIQSQRETEELLAARERFEKAADEVAKWTATQTDLNLELGTVNNKAKRSEQRLYSGQVSNPKELEDLQHEVESLGRRRGALEDKILEAMITFEDAQSEFESAENSLREIESGWEQSQLALREEQGQLAIQLQNLLKVRQKHKARIGSDSLAEYEALRARKNGVAVVELADGTCMGCHVSVSAQKAKQAERGESVTCNGCGRILCPC